MKTDELLSMLHNVKKSPAGWVACCPAHEDRHQSLSISTGSDERILLKCFAGCATEDVVAKLGLTMADLMPETKERNERTIVDTYDYRDQSGALAYQVVRFHPKDFRQRRPDGKGGWKWSLGDTKRVLYHLAELQAGIAAGRRVFVVEGEKDVHTLERLGFVATTNAGGAGKWTDDYTAALTGAHVIVLPDNDLPGRNHAELIAKALAGKASSVKVVELPGQSEKADVTDWVARGGTADELKALIIAENTPKRYTLLDAISKVSRYKDEPMPKSIDFPWQALNIRTRGMRPGWLCILAGYPGSGKTAAAMEIAYMAAKHEHHVLFNSLEMNDEELALRMVQRWGLDTDRLYRGQLTEQDRDAFDLAVNFPFYENVTITAERSMAGLESRVEEYRPDIVIVDYIGLMDMGRDSAQEGTTKLSRGMKALARRYAVAAVCLSQLSRPAEKQKLSAPTMFDLRASGALEADADQIIIVFREDIQGDAEGRFIIAKSRHARPGRPIPFRFDGDRQTFTVIDEALERAMGQGWSVFEGGLS